jgi:hypothetical protein
LTWFFPSLYSGHDQLGLLLLGEMSAVDVETDDVGDRVEGKRRSATVHELIFHRTTVEVDADALHRLQAIAAIEEHCRLTECVLCDLLRLADTHDFDGLAKAILQDVLAERLELLVGHHGEDIGGGVHLVFVAPCHGRHLPACRPISIGHCLR